MPTIQEFLKSEKMMKRFMESSTDAREIALERMSDKYKTASPETRNIVMNRVLLQAEGLPPSWKEVPGEFAGNFIPSGIEFGRNLWQVLKDPKKTVKTLGQTLLGGVQRLIPGEQSQEEKFNILVDFYKDRYGGEANLRRTISQDPVGFLNDASAVFGITGGLLRASQIPVLSKTAQVSTKLAGVDPLTAGLRQVSKLHKSFPSVSRTGKPMTSTERSVSLAETAIKIPSKKGLDKVSALGRIDELADQFLNLRLESVAGGTLKKGIKLYVERHAVRLLGENIKRLQRQVDDIIKRGESLGKRIKHRDLMKELDALVDEIRSTPGLDPSEAVKLLEFRNTIAIKKLTIGADLERRIKTALRVKGIARIDKRNILSNIDEMIRKNRQKVQTLETAREAQALNNLLSKIDDLPFDLVSQDQLSGVLKTLIQEEAILLPTEVQRLKVLLGKTYRPNTNAIQDAIGKVAKEKLREGGMNVLKKAYPELNALNPEQGVMIELQQAIAQRVRMISQEKLSPNIGLLAGAGGATIGAAVTGGNVMVSLKTGLAFAAGAVLVQKLLTSTKIQIALARALNFANMQLARAGKLPILTTSTAQAGRAQGVVETSPTQTQPQL